MNYSFPSSTGLSRRDRKAQKENTVQAIAQVIADRFGELIKFKNVGDAASTTEKEVDKFIKENPTQAHLVFEALGRSSNIIFTTYIKEIEAFKAECLKIKAAQDKREADLMVSLMVYTSFVKRCRELAKV